MAFLSRRKAVPIEDTAKFLHEQFKRSVKWTASLPAGGTLLLFGINNSDSMDGNTPLVRTGDVLESLLLKKDVAVRVEGCEFPFTEGAYVSWGKGDAIIPHVAVSNTTKSDMMWHALRKENPDAVIAAMSELAEPCTDIVLDVKARKVTATTADGCKAIAFVGWDLKPFSKPCDPIASAGNGDDDGDDDGDDSDAEKEIPDDLLSESDV